ncbi:MAG: hypothetical protein ABIQ40_06495 [Bacteroidia bacterium]
MKNVQNTFFLFCLAIAFCSCHRDQPTEPIYTPLNAEFKAWCAYKPGSWWTYKEISSANRDSMWVSYYSEDKKHLPTENYYYYQLSMHVSSLNDSFETHYYNGAPIYPDGNKQWNFGENYNINQGTLSEGRFYFTTTLPLSLQSYTTVIQLDSFDLSGSGDRYYTINKINNSVSAYSNWIKTEYYARNIGVIRREMFNGEIWEVENYNIVQ